MSKIAFIFPGQGSQYTGMGKDFYEAYPEAKEVYETSSKAAGIDVAELCFTENDRLNQTEYTQIAMFTTEVALLKVIEKMGIKADMTAGLSLGEYAALEAAGVMELSDLCALVRKRGLYMQEAYPTGGAMAAVIALDTKVTEEVCAGMDGVVGIANYNCPGQLVISGEEAAVNQAMEKLKEAGAKRCIPLKVSGPFHSPLLEKAAKQLAEELEDKKLCDPKIPYYSNVEATKVTDASPIKELLPKQVISSVRFQQSIEKMIEEGIDTFIEIGPGKTLTGFLGRINKEVKAINIDKLEDLEKLKEL